MCILLVVGTVELQIMMIIITSYSISQKDLTAKQPP